MRKLRVNHRYRLQVMPERTPRWVQHLAGHVLPTVYRTERAALHGRASEVVCSGLMFEDIPPTALMPVACMTVSDTYRTRLREGLRRTLRRESIVNCAGFGLFVCLTALLLTIVLLLTAQPLGCLLALLLALGAGIIGMLAMFVTHVHANLPGENERPCDAEALFALAGL